MRDSLSAWLRDADGVRHLEHFRMPTDDARVRAIRARGDDLYIALVGELFDALRAEGTAAQDWARLGNAFSLYAAPDRRYQLNALGVAPAEAALYSASAFYYGGFPASAYVTLREMAGELRDLGEVTAACFNLLSRSTDGRSRITHGLLRSLRSGDMETIAAIAEEVRLAAERELIEGPDSWIPARLLERLVQQFSQTNVRAVLPAGEQDFWTPLVESLLLQGPPLWEYFPSQIQAINAGLLSSQQSFTLQMPTGAGKTTLCETLLFWHSQHLPADCAVLLVPYRSLAFELRGTLVRRLNRLRISARCAYGGTVPSVDEVRELADTRVLVATPEALSGLLSADDDFFKRISLVICDEGHLLDGEGRGVALELLLARMRARRNPGAPRFVFVSAIVPNVEEINAWLGGADRSVVRSTYRPALAEFAMLRPSGAGVNTSVTLLMHPHEPAPVSYPIRAFLTRRDFSYINPASGRTRTYPFVSIKAQAVAAGRKALGMGMAVLFAANKRGRQGAIGLAEELLEQLRHGLPLPDPRAHVPDGALEPAVAYLRAEYDDAWVGTRALTAGAVLHHGDIPQETREVLEGLLRGGVVRFAVCTNTLAEGVNLPVRTLVLYSVQRRNPGGRATDLLTRDIKNLVGRAGRAGATTAGLVICANPQQWGLVAQVARDAEGEPVRGALYTLMSRLQAALVRQNVTLTNELLESAPQLHALTDGVDATLVNLAAEEIGYEALADIAVGVAAETFANRQLAGNARELLDAVFRLRARRIFEIKEAGRLGWISTTGARPRLLASVEGTLLPLLADWGEKVDPLDPEVVSAIIGWAWEQPDVASATRDAYRLEDGADTDAVRERFLRMVRTWLEGEPFRVIAERSGEAIDDTLSIHSSLLSYTVQVQVEQAVALLERFADAQGVRLGEAAKAFPEHLRFGVPTLAARMLAARGVRHRRAFVALGADAAVATAAALEGPDGAIREAGDALRANPDRWQQQLGTLVLERTLEDITAREP